MRLIERYIFRRIAVLSIATLSASLGIVWVALILGRFDFLTTSGQSFLTMMKYAALLLPDAMPVAMPFAAVIAIANTLSTMNQDSELVVINAAGSPRSTVLRPVILMAVILSVVSFGVENFVMPQGDLAKRVIMANVRADLLGSIIQEDSFQKLDDNLYVEVAKHDADGRLSGLFIADSRDPTVDLIYYARAGALVDRGSKSILLMKDGEIQRRDVKTGNVSIIRFVSYAFDLSEFKSESKDIFTYTRERSLQELFNPSPDDRLYQRHPQRFSAEIHKRFTDWVFPLVFALVSFVVAGDPRSHREMRLPAALVAVTTSFIIFWLHYFAYGKARNSALFTPLMYVATYGVIVVMAFMIATNRRLSVPPFLIAAARPAVRATAALRNLWTGRRAGEQRG